MSQFNFTPVIKKKIKWWKQSTILQQQRACSKDAGLPVGDNVPLSQRTSKKPCAQTAACGLTDTFLSDSTLEPLGCVILRRCPSASVHLSSPQSLLPHRAHSIDKHNQYRLRARTDAFHSQPASVPAVKPGQIVGRWAAERFSLQSTQPADTVLRDTTITGWQASMFVFTVGLSTRTSRHPSMRVECKFELSINLWISWFNLNCLFALPNLHVWEISRAICPV